MSEFDGILNKLPGMSVSEKEELCSDIRKKIIATVENNGGHLASNLGVVELTVGLYSVLDPFRDKVIWDVGHQCYAHKLLTGRADAFGTLRQLGGISGFPMGSESPADCFETGHSSTSVSAAVGFARARKISGEQYHICAVIGDGAFGSGMVYEALNDAGQSDDDIIVILNDNGMSISPNVGAMHRYLIKLRSGRRYIKAKKGVQKALSKLAAPGRFIERQIQRVKTMMRSAVVPEGELFIDLGWKYLGPIDGHDVQAVSEAVSKAEFIGGPVIIHAITKKGRGYGPAENNPSAYHGVSPASPGTAAGKNDRSFSGNLGRELCAVAKENKKIAAVSAAMAGGTGLSAFAENFPDRYFDVGIAEEHAVTMSAAMARAGLRPFLCLYSTFSQRAYDQIVHDIAIPGNGVVLCLDRAGAAGADGRTHQGIYDLSFLAPLPGITVCAPCSLSEQSEMIREAAAAEVPYVIRYPAVSVLEDSFPEYASIRSAPGRGTLLRDDTGLSENPVIFISVGSMTAEALRASRILSDSRIGSAVFDARYMKPLDADGIGALMKKHPRSAVVTLEDGAASGGFGSEILAFASENGLGSDRIKIIGYPDCDVPHGKIEELRKMFGLDAVSVAAAAKNLRDKLAERSGNET